MLQLLSRFASFAIAVVVPGQLVAQGELRITEPAAGTVLNPGQTITVSVSASGGPFTSVGIVGPGHMNGNYILKSSPYQFSFTVQSKITPGLDTIEAMGSTASGPVIAEVKIDVERPDTPQKISVDHPRLELPMGGKLPIAVFGTYADGSVVNLSRSTQTKYRLGSPDIVSVSNEGRVTALAPGSTLSLLVIKITKSQSA